MFTLYTKMLYLTHNLKMTMNVCSNYFSPWKTYASRTKILVTYFIFKIIS